MIRIKETTCKDRIDKSYKGRIADIRKLWNLYCNDPEASDSDLGRFNEYGLCFDYVAPGTFERQRQGYFRYQLSWGGPSDEFRFYCDERFKPTRIEYWFMDWFDGAKRILRQGKDFDLLVEIFDDFDECGLIQAEYNKAVES